MSLKPWIFASLLIVLSACANSHQEQEGGLLPGSTGGFDADGTDYVHNGDFRVDEALRKFTADNRAPHSPLAKRLKEFEINRFKAGEKEPTRLGDDRFILKVFFKDRATVEFQGRFTQKGSTLLVDADRDGFHLNGQFDDSDHESLGQFTLNDKDGNKAVIFYKAYKASLNVRENRSAPVLAGSAAEAQMKSFKSGSFAWVHNWTVLSGVSVYLVDIVKTVGGGKAATPPIYFAFKGESKRTGLTDHPVTSLNSPVKEDVKLVGNGEGTGSRMFEFTIPDDKDDKKAGQFILEVEDEKPDQAPVDPNDVPMIFGPADDPNLVTDIPKSKPQPEAPAPQNGSQPLPPAEPVQPLPPQEEIHEVPATGGASNTSPSFSGQFAPPETSPSVLNLSGAYFKIDLSQPRSARMIRDYNQNVNSSSTNKFIAKFQRAQRVDMQNFLNHANPFRGMIESIGHTYDVAPAFAYLTVVESGYFTGNRPYQIQGNGSSSAVGPFQLLVAMAKEMGTRVTGGANDERRYFAPSACTAAKYTRKMVDKFRSGDATLAVLGYNQGDGGAAAAIYCAYGSSGNHAGCASRINHGFTGRDYGRFLKLANNYDYKFIEMERMGALPQHMRDYVGKYLAVYFIANNMSRYGFKISANAPKNLPTNGTVYPASAILDSKCETATRAIF